jgi:erythromycin esterase
MLETLVREMGFTVLAIEASAPDVAVVNDYVVHGKGDAETAVAGLDFWAWRTSEVVDVIRWMRTWNEDARHTTKLQIHGFDMQNPAASVDVLREYLRRVDPDFAQSAGSFDADTLDVVERRLRDHRDAYAAKSSQIEWIWARRQVDLIRQASELLRVTARAFEVRDRWMAANVKWILDHEPPGTKMILWAHNGHVATEPPRFFPGGSMGMHLRRMYGGAIRVFGIAFDRGAFRAASPGGEVRSHEALPAKTASFDGALAAAGPSLFVLDLRSATGLSRRWVESPLEHRSIGLTYQPETPGNDWVTIHPIRSYDAVIFVGKTTPSRDF